MARIKVRHNRGWARHRKANHARRHKPCDQRWIKILERALEEMLIGLDTLEHLADEAGYALTSDGLWVEIEKVQEPDSNAAPETAPRSESGRQFIR